MPTLLPHQEGPAELRNGERHDDLMSSTLLPPVSFNLKGWPLPHLPPLDRWRRLSWPLLDESRAAAAAIARACGVAKTDPRNNPCYKHGLQRQRRQRESIGNLDYHQITSTFYWGPQPVQYWLLNFDMHKVYTSFQCIIVTFQSWIRRIFFSPFNFPTHMFNPTEIVFFTFFLSHAPLNRQEKHQYGI